MSDRIPAARFAAYSVILAAGIPASITSREWWTLSLPIIAIVLVEAVMLTDRVYAFLWGKAREMVIEQAAKRAVELILAEQRNREAAGLIASMRGRLPDYRGRSRKRAAGDPRARRRVGAGLAAVAANVYSAPQ